jgi:hypothetical protein
MDSNLGYLQLERPVVANFITSQGAWQTGVPVEIEIVGELAATLEPFLLAPTLRPTFVRRPSDQCSYS